MPPVLECRVRTVPHFRLNARYRHRSDKRHKRDQKMVGMYGSRRFPSLPDLRFLHQYYPLITYILCRFKNESQDPVSPSPSAPGDSTQQNSGLSTREKIIVYNSSQDGTPSSADKKASVAAAANYGNDNTFAIYLKPQFTRAPIKDAGRVAFLGESSNLSLLVHDNQGTKDVVHYPLPENVRGAKARVNELDDLEIEILHQRGAFLLPPRSLCDELVEAFFTWVAPVVPVINRSKFMSQYKDPKNPPSFLLLQAVLLAGSRVCSNPQLMDVNGSTTAAAMTFFKRAKALFDANYEDDRVTIVQSLVLMGWYWEGPEGLSPSISKEAKRLIQAYRAEACCRCYKECILLDEAGNRRGSGFRDASEVMGK